MALLVAAVFACSACASSPPADATPSPRQGDVVYVSIGDSYAAGEQLSAGGGLATSRSGFAYRVADRMAASGEDLQLINFGCVGATSTDLLTRKGCPDGGLGPGATPYPDSTQADAAIAALSAHRGHVRLVTISIGGNDVNACLPPGGRPPVRDVDCVDQTLSELRTNMRTLLARIRAVTGPGVPVVGITYPDFFLGAWVLGDQASARASVPLFRDVLNPALRTGYEAAHARFVDVTSSTGAYGPLTTQTDLPPYGMVPVPVARACVLTAFCTSQDVHPTDRGYAEIADEVLRAATM